MTQPIPAELLLHVPGCESGAAPLLQQPLAGGRGVNGVWRVRTVRGDFVLRLRHDPLDRPGSRAAFELESHRLAAAAGIAPPLVGASPDGRWLVMEFVAAPAWTEAQLLTAEGIDSLGALLQRLHGLECAHLPRMDAVVIARGYLEDIARLAEPGTSLARKEFAELEKEAGSALPTARASLVHGDLMASNLVGSAAALRLVDWEYAQRTHPTWDLACLLGYYPALESRQERLLAACGLASAEDRHILWLQRRLFERLNRLWQLAGPPGSG